MNSRHFGLTTASARFDKSCHCSEHMKGTGVCFLTSPFNTVTPSVNARADSRAILAVRGTQTDESPSEKVWSKSHPPSTHRRQQQPPQGLLLNPSTPPPPPQPLHPTPPHHPPPSAPPHPPWAMISECYYKFQRCLATGWWITTGAVHGEDLTLCMGLSVYTRICARVRVCWQRKPVCIAGVPPAPRQ